jgi:Zn-dependent alcohol dehydrogenase
VEKVGAKVTIAQPGDPVVLSYNHCLNCTYCKDGSMSYCADFLGLNLFRNTKPCLHTASSAEPDIQGRFFGQSSFASLSIVDENSVVNVKGLVKDKAELMNLSPLGCGIQTGLGTAVNASKAKPTDIIAVCGLGGVGLSAVAVRSPT